MLAALVERQTLFELAVSHYTAMNDIACVFQNRDIMQPEFIQNFFSTLTQDQCALLSSSSDDNNASSLLSNNKDVDKNKKKETVLLNINDIQFPVNMSKANRKTEPKTTYPCLNANLDIVTNDKNLFGITERIDKAATPSEVKELCDA